MKYEQINVNEPKIGEINFMLKFAASLLKTLKMLYVNAVKKWNKGGDQKGSSLPKPSNKGIFPFSAINLLTDKCQQASPET